jgi:hypothetical protein
VMWLFQHLLEVEQELMVEETPMPVFFTPETAEVASIYDDVRRSVHNDQAGSAAEGTLILLLVFHISYYSYVIYLITHMVYIL